MIEGHIKLPSDPSVRRCGYEPCLNVVPLTKKYCCPGHGNAAYKQRHGYIRTTPEQERANYIKMMEALGHVFNTGTDTNGV